jgi:hypothetical protein
MDVSGCGAAFYTKNNRFKVQFSSASIPLAPTISSGRQSSYGNPRLPSVVEAPTVLLGRGKPETIAGYRSPAAVTRRPIQGLSIKYRIAERILGPLGTLD